MIGCHLNFDNRFARLPEDFYHRQPPKPLDNPRLVSANPAAAQLIGLAPELLHSREFLAGASGRDSFPGSEPLAQAYSGHQFGSYNPQLGDGRGLLLGEVRGPDGALWGLHLKGAGQTPYSRFGDGRAVLRSSIREYLCSEAVAALGIPSTRALSVVDSDTPVYREQQERGAMIIRLARSHVRFGHFEYFHYTDRPDLVKRLADEVIDEHFAAAGDGPDRYQRFLAEVCRRTGQLIAWWQAYGFAHGVMNTDNMSIIGDTFDYGPFAFLDDFDPAFICNHSDHQGRYAFNRQPGIGLWNLNALAHALSSLIDSDGLRDALQQYEPALLAHFDALIHRRLGLEQRLPGDDELVNGLFTLMQQNRCDYHRFFRRLCDSHSEAGQRALRDSVVDRGAFDAWFQGYRERLAQETASDAERAQAMRAVNPLYVLRNYLVQNAIERAERERDYGEVDTLLRLIQHPFEEQPDLERYAEEPPDWGRQLEISCSS